MRNPEFKENFCNYCEITFGDYNSFFEHQNRCVAKAKLGLLNIPSLSLINQTMVLRGIAQDAISGIKSPVMRVLLDRLEESKTALIGDYLDIQKIINDIKAGMMALEALTTAPRLVRDKRLEENRKPQAEGSVT